MTGTAVRHLSFEEFEQLPDQPGRLELLRGELIELPPAKRKHNKLAHRIWHHLSRMITDSRERQVSPSSGEVYHEMGYLLSGHTWLQPDVSVTHAGQGGDEYFTGAPALAVEIVSASNTANQINSKIAEYFAQGALEVWIVYPGRGELWLYRPNGIAEKHTGEFRSDVLGGFTLNIAELLQD